LNIDLHIHTTASDGSLSPAQVVQEAGEAGLSVIAIADHDTTDGVPEALAAQQENNVEVIPSVEVSATDPEGEAHILGYWMDYESPAFQSFLQKPRENRPDRIIEMCEKLTGLGLPVQPDEVYAVAGGRASVGRPHLARVMLDKGYIQSMDDAFRLYLKRGKPAFVQRFKNSARDTIRLIHECGGISVLAHPGLIEEPRLVDSLVEAGIMGIEAYCHDHDRATTERFLALAKQHGLLITGGSDYHGEMLQKSFKLGDLSVPYACYEELKAARDRLASQ
jgi:predicted metal-dependent phosphoesterase TrpH